MLKMLLNGFIKGVRVIWFSLLFIFLTWSVYTAGYHTFLEKFECVNIYQKQDKEDIWV